MQIRNRLRCKYFSLSVHETEDEYDDTLWTKDYGIVFKLYCLAQSKGLITEFSALPSDPNIISAIKASNVVPTHSPKDPNFSAWWTAHQVEWEA